MDQLTDIIGKHDLPFEQRQQLLSDLRAREDAALHLLVHAGHQFGLFPQIVKEMLAQTGLGTPMDPDVRVRIKQEYDALIEELRRSQ